MKRTIFILALPLIGAQANAAIVDNFTVAYANSLQSGTWVDFQAGGMLGGERDVQLEVLNNPFNTFCDLDINGAGMAISSQGFGMTSNVYLQYDRTGDEAGNTGAGKFLTNGGTGVALLGGFNDTLRIGFIGNDLDVNVKAVARLSGAIIGSNSALRPGGSGVGTLDIAMSPAVLASADSLTFVFSGATNADFAISKIETVPEPLSLAVLGLGAALAVRRRRTTK